MPVTPFHFGPGLLIKAAAPRIFSFRVFVLANIIIDAEAFFFILINQGPFHRFLHTYLGSTIVAILCILIGKPMCYWLTGVWNKLFQGLSIVNGEIPKTALISASFLGSYSQVFLDSIMHGDVKPFAPFFDSNHFLQALNYVQLHLVCALTGLVGIIIYFFRGFKTNRVEYWIKLMKFIKVLVITLTLIIFGYGLLIYYGMFFL